MDAVPFERTVVSARRLTQFAPLGVRDRFLTFAILGRSLCGIREGFPASRRCQGLTASTQGDPHGTHSQGGLENQIVFRSGRPPPDRPILIAFSSVIRHRPRHQE